MTYLCEKDDSKWNRMGLGKKEDTFTFGKHANPMAGSCLLGVALMPF